MNWLQTKAVLFCVMLLVSHATQSDDNTYYFNAEVTRYHLLTQTYGHHHQLPLHPKRNLPQRSHFEWLRCPRQDPIHGPY